MHFKIPTTDNHNHDLSLEKGDVLVFVGANGSGKTRLGFYLEDQLFQLTNTGFEQKQSELKRKRQELDNIENSINDLSTQLVDIQNISNEKIIEKSLIYQNHKIMADDRSVYTRIELAHMAISGQITGQVQFHSISFSGNFPAENLSELSGGQIIINDISLEVDLLKVVGSDNQSIENARRYLMAKLDALLNSNQRNRDQLLREFRTLEEELAITIDSNFDYCERIAAHRSLVIRENSAPKNINEAVNDLRFGNVSPTQNTNSKWGNKPFGTLQTDFDKLMVAFLSEEADISARFRQGYNLVQDKPITKFDKALIIWNQLLPHRILRLDGLNLVVQTREQDNYSISEMSEGERSIFYILGKCLFAMENSLIIIDEPDIHIHKAILSSFFNLIEKERDDCAFIYITHDLEFAASRRRSKNYVLHSYKHINKWEIQEIQSNELPDATYNKICGSRKNILFVEGRDQSLDKIYSYIYDDLEVLSVGSCQEVKDYTKSMNKNSSHHRVKCFGLIDRDDLDEQEISNLLSIDIYVLPVAIIENIFLLSDVAKHIFRITGEEARFNPDDFASSVIEWIDSQEDWKAKSIKYRLGKLYRDAIGGLPTRIGELSTSCNQAIQDLDPRKIVDDFNLYYAAELETARRENDSAPLLRICRGKHLLAKLAGELSVTTQTSLKSKILDNIHRDEALLEAIKNELPRIPFVTSL